MTGGNNLGSAVTLLRSSLAGDGWDLLDFEDGQQMLVSRALGRPRGSVHPRIAARQLSPGGRWWWKWTAPAEIAGIAIAPVNDVHRARQLILRTLAKPGAPAP